MYVLHARSHDEKPFLVNPRYAEDMADANDRLDTLRLRIDSLDQKIIALLSERANIVVDIGKEKQNTDTPIYAPHRERAVLDRVLAFNEGPLSNKTIEAIYRELMSGSFQLEKPLAIAHLAPTGSFSHIAAIRQLWFERCMCRCSQHRTGLSRGSRRSLHIWACSV